MVNCLQLAKSLRSSQGYMHFSLACSIVEHAKSPKTYATTAGRLFVKLEDSTWNVASRPCKKRLVDPVGDGRCTSKGLCMKTQA